ncbi:pyroglutamyl peptidase type I [Histoplasma capsulatum]|uniref:Pyroglutamyl peptidase type I n=1 Tax=Ajellomyces capsulatus TaxID=5037 RepID=A0A8A1MM26_AJECA|nr:pyroglutamyl peptidase type I [Histoplasma capsulatum]
MGDFGPAASEEREQLGDSLVAIKESVQDIHVLVTGFGPFKSNLVNPSFLIASAIPKIITITQTTPTSTPTSTPRRILIHTHPVPIRVSYRAVRFTIPAIIDAFKNGHDGRPPDFVIHIGMANTRDYYAVETMAHRDDYGFTDVDGQVGFEDGEAIWKAMGLPEVLRPGPCTVPGDDEMEGSGDAGGIDGDGSPSLRKSSTTVYTTTGISATVVTDTTATASDANATTTTTTTARPTSSSSSPSPSPSPDMDKQPQPEQQDQTSAPPQTPLNEITTTITTTASHTPTCPSPPGAHFLKTWQSLVPRTADVRLSDDAGRYLCEFIYYTSLMHAYLERRNRSVVFLHVPGRADDEAIQLGKEVAAGLVRCLAACWVV